MSVYKKLQQARIALQNLKLEKTGQNKFAGYKYFELADFLPAVQSIFSERGLCGVVCYTAETASLTIHDTEVEHSSPIVFHAPMGSAALKGAHEIQNIGAVETYQRRYLYVTALEIVEHDALDASLGKDEGKGKGIIKPTTGIEEAISEEQKVKVKKLVSAVTDWLSSGSVEDAVLETENGNLDTEERIYFWTFFDSKQRAAMTKVYKELKAKKEPA